MKPIKFDEQMFVLAENQPEYQPLPVYQNNFETISCWKLSLWERVKILFTGKLWLRQMNYGDLLQPQLPTVEFPFEHRQL